MRIHSFPDNYYLCGPIRGRCGRVQDLDQHGQVANSVPPPLAELLARRIKEALCQDIQPQTMARLPGIPAGTHGARSWMHPFMDAPCDGSENCNMSAINLKENAALAALCPGRNTLPVGIKTEHSPPLLICPRRLLYLGRVPSRNLLTDSPVQRELFRLFG